MLTLYNNTSHIKRIHNNETRAQVSMYFILHLMRTVRHGLCCYANRSAPKQNGSRLGRVVSCLPGDNSDLRFVNTEISYFYGH